MPSGSTQISICWITLCNLSSLVWSCRPGIGVRLWQMSPPGSNLPPPLVLPSLTSKWISPLPRHPPHAPLPPTANLTSSGHCWVRGSRSPHWCCLLSRCNGQCAGGVASLDCILKGIILIGTDKVVSMFSSSHIWGRLGNTHQSIQLGINVSFYSSNFLSLSPLFTKAPFTSALNHYLQNDCNQFP